MYCARKLVSGRIVYFRKKKRPQPEVEKKKKMKMRKRRINKLLLAGLLLFIITGCSTTKHLPEDELLYIGTPTPKIVGYNEADNGEATLEEVQGALNVAPNNSFFGSPNLRIPFPLGLWVYNRFERYEKGIGKWIFKETGR